MKPGPKSRRRTVVVRSTAHFPPPVLTSLVLLPWPPFTIDASSLGRPAVDRPYMEHEPKKAQKKEAERTTNPKVEKQIL